MRLLSRWLRAVGPPRVSLLVMPHSDTTEPADQATWELAISELDRRQLPATWAVVDGSGRWTLGAALVTSRESHEMAFVAREDNLTTLVADFRRQAQLAKRVRLALRTLVTTSSGMHPSSLAQLGVEAVVPLANRETNPSPTGSLRGVAWGTWEVPVTDELGTPSKPMECKRLLTRLNMMLNQSTRMNLVWQLGRLESPRQLRPALGFFDLLADLRQRGWLRVETYGAAAAGATSRLTLPRRAA
jgi:hypothetical protein